MKHSGSHSFLKDLGRAGIVLLVTLLLIVVGAYLALFIIIKGPSPTVCKLFVNTVKETSAGGFLADMFLSEEEIAQLRSSNDFIGGEEDVDPSLIVIPEKNTPETKKDDPDLPPETTPATSGTSQTDPTPVTPPEEDTGIEILDIVGPTYNGKLMIVKDPTRVMIGTLDAYGEKAHGLTVEEMMEKYGAIAGINAGGFDDPSGSGTGAIPDGLVIADGKLVWGNMDTSYYIAGMDDKGLLYTSKMTAREALKKGVKTATSFGPTLVSNGKIATTNDSSLNPRTAVGQRADGAILLLVINGRMVNCLGASMLDIATIMLDYGAVNATNLDGGSSSIMVYKGEYLTKSAYLFGVRSVPTAILVK